MPADTSASMAADRPDTGTVVALRNIVKAFPNGTLAIGNVDLDIKRGQFVSLLGPSGCGKSTLLRIIAGLTQPSSGTVEWPMNAKGERRSAASEVGFVFQEPTLMPWATVAKNVWLPFKLSGVSFKDARERIEQALDMVGLAKFGNSYPRELSGGMKMRVSIARALATKPQVLLMDEPFAALDEITRQKLNDDLLRLWQQHNWTIVFVTHSVFESAYLSDRIVVMGARPGRIIEDIAVPAPYPRDEEYRTSAIYAQTCKSASHALASAMSKTDHL